MNPFAARFGRSRLPRTLPPQRTPVCPSCRAPVAGPLRDGDLCARCGSPYYLRRRTNAPTVYLLSAAQAVAFDANQPGARPQSAPADAAQAAAQSARNHPAPPPEAQSEARAGGPAAGTLPLPEPQEKRRFNWMWVHGTAEGQWRQLRRSLTQHARDGNWLLYRNARFEMAEVRRKQDRLREALELYLEVWYLDLNGPNDCWGVSGVRRLYEEAPFNPVNGLTTPMVARWVNRIAERLLLDARQVELLFAEIATRLYQAMGLPLTPRDAWRSVRVDLLVRS